MFSNDMTEFGRCWSSEAGKLDALKQAVLIAERRSAEAFVRGQDNTANALRDCARELQQLVTDSSGRLGAFIEENRRRQHEMRPKH